MGDSKKQKTCMEHLIKAAEKNRREIAKKMDEIQKKNYSPTQNADLFNITMNGAFKVISCNINPQLVEDLEYLEELVSMAVTDVMTQIRKDMEDTSRKIIISSLKTPDLE